MPTLAPNSLITVTGVTGYIASHVGLAALQAGHRVRGTVRSLARAESLKAAYVKQGILAEDLDRRLEFVVLDDLLSEDEWLRVLEGVDGVLHGALPMDKFQDHEIIHDAIEGTLSVLRAATKVPSIKRVVLTSSSAAVITSPMFIDRPLTDKDWNNDAVRIVENKEPVDQDPAIKRASSILVYSAAKTKAEKAAWEFVEKQEPHFDLVSILPDTTFGPVLYGDPPSSASIIASVLKNDSTWTQLLPAQWFVDVRDVGKLHVLGLTEPTVGGKRFLATAEPFGWNVILGILRKHFPSVEVPEDFEGGELDRQQIDNSPATQLLGGWIGLEQSIVDLAKSIGY